MATSTSHLTHASFRLRRLVVGLIGLSSVAMVLLPGGYLDPALVKVERMIVQPVTAASLDCAMGEMADMQMPMPTDCTSR